MADLISCRIHRRVAAVLLCNLLVVQSLAHADDRPTSRPSAVVSVAAAGITVSDLDASVAFFHDVLTFEKVSETRFAGEEFASLHGLATTATARVARLKLGDEFVELTEYELPKGRPFPADSRSNDRWFQHIAIIVRDMEQAHTWLHEKMVRHASKDPQRLPDWNRNAAGIKAFYFRDPDGHFLEVLQFPPDKGDPKWHRQTSALFLGIDHTAIVVNDTEASLRFYRDVLGFRVIGGSENYGPEQEALNNVAGAHLRITTLKAEAGPAIELLEYLSPRDGRPYPADARANDLLHWQTLLISRDTAALAAELRGRKWSFVSDGLVRAGSSASDARAGFLVRDPDGHALRIGEALPPVRRAAELKESP